MHKKRRKIRRKIDLTNANLAAIISIWIRFWNVLERAGRERSYD